MPFLSFQFPHGWPSYIHCLSVFPCQAPIPKDWLEQRNIDTVYHPVCNCHSYSSGFLQDPAVSTWYLGICPFKHPYGLYKYAQNILILDLDDQVLINWLQNCENLEVTSFLSNLEYFLYNEFHTFLSYPITMFQFVRYSKTNENAIELKAKVFGMAHGKVLISATTSLGDINCHFKIDNSTKDSWKSQLFFAV